MERSNTVGLELPGTVRFGDVGRGHTQMHASLGNRGLNSPDQKWAAFRPLRVVARGENGEFVDVTAQKRELVNYAHAGGPDAI
jgi:hypothetical protein